MTIEDVKLPAGFKFYDFGAGNTVMPLQSDAYHFGSKAFGVQIASATGLQYARIIGFNSDDSLEKIQQLANEAVAELSTT